jgi:hypothetical protein
MGKTCPFTKKDVEDMLPLLAFLGWPIAAPFMLMILSIDKMNKLVARLFAPKDKVKEIAEQEEDLFLTEAKVEVDNILKENND